MVDGCPRRFEAQHVVHSVRNARPPIHHWCALMEGVDGTCGMLTTNASKEVMCVALQELLSSNRIHISSQLLCLSMPPREAIEQMLSEIRAFMIFVDPPRTLFAKPRRTFTGKMGGHNDDVAIALQLGVLAMQIFNRNAKYSRFQ